MSAAPRSTEAIEVFFSYAHEDENLRDELEKHLIILKRQRVITGWHDRRIGAGREWEGEIDAHLNTARVILLLVSADFLASDYCWDVEVKRAMERHEAGEARVLPIILRPVLWEGAPFSKLQALPTDANPVINWKNHDEAFLNVAQGIRATVEKLAVAKAPGEGDILYIRHLELTNIRCFDKFKISFETTHGETPTLWTMILGDNATGKTTLLRNIALGLCNESDAAALVKNLPGSLIRQGARRGTIKITLQYTNRPQQSFVLTTNIIRSSDNRTETIRQSTTPKSGFPWDDIFVCGYGTHRAGQASASYKAYSCRHAVSTLFDSQAALQNPEVILLRQHPERRAQLERRLLEILMLDTPEDAVITPDDSHNVLSIRGPWGTFPLTALSDGYRSTLQWVLDLWGWAIYANRFLQEGGVGGILLLDELEQHLHPRWQRHIVHRLRKQFPQMQIISTTHTPLVAAGVGDIQSSMLIRLKATDKQTVEGEILDKRALRGKRADQILSEVFELFTSRSLGSQDDLARYAELQAKERTPDEEQELKQLSEQLQQSLVFGENSFEQEVERAVTQVLEERLRQPPSELLGLEVKRQLREVFAVGEE